jgi:hypothetical protein
MIGCTAPSVEQKKAEHVRESIDNELGITTPFNCLWSETKVNENNFLISIIISCIGIFLYRRLYGYCPWLLSCSYCSSSKLYFFY